MSEWAASLHPGAAGWTGALVRAGWQGGLAILLVWALCRLLPRLSGRSQCWLWRLAYLKLLVSLAWSAPLSLPLLPARSPGATAASAWRAERPDVTPSLHSRRARERAGGAGNEAPGWTPGPRATTMPALGGARRLAPKLLLFLWLLGAGVCGTQLFLDWRRTQRLRAEGEAVREEALIAACGELCRRLEIGHEPELRTADPLDCPVLIGVARPTILMPAAFPTRFAPAELRLMLAHELAHLKRRDLLWAWLPNLGRALFFFHPLVWLAEGEWRLAQEMACDEEVVLSTGASHARYGAMLLEVMGHPQRSVPASRLMAGVAESYSTVRRRLVAIRRVRADTPPGRARGAGVRALAAGLLAVAGAAGIIPWRLTARAAPPVARRLAASAASPLRGLPDLAAPAGGDTQLMPLQGRNEQQEKRPAPPPGPISPAAVVPEGGDHALPAARMKASAAIRTEIDAAGTTGTTSGMSADDRSDPDRMEVGPGAQRLSRPSETYRQNGDPIVSAPQDAKMPGDPPAPPDPGKGAERPPDLPDAASRERDRPEGKPLTVLVVEKESPDKDSLRRDPGRLAIEKQIAFKKQFGRDPAMGEPGSLQMPKPFAIASARIGWRPSPLFLQPKHMEVAIGRGIDPRLFKKLMVAAKEGGIDPAEFKKMVALASLDGALDPRALRKLLSQAHQGASGEYRTREEKQRPRTEKELWHDRQLDELKRGKMGEQADKSQEDPPKSEAAPGD